MSWLAGESDGVPDERLPDGLDLPAVFNPVTQGRKFDPDRTYIKKWVPELREADDPHEPHDPIVDHAEERREALDRYERIKR